MGGNPAGDIALTIDPNGFAATASYDVRGRLISQTAPSGGGTTTYAYDLASRLTSLTDPVGNVTSWTHDDVGRAKTEVDPLGKTTTFACDVVGNLTRRTDRLGRIVDYGYDANDRPTTETWLPAGGGTAVNAVIYTYDDAGRVTQIQDGASKYAHGYAAANRPITVNDQGPPACPRSP